MLLVLMYVDPININIEIYTSPTKVSGAISGTTAKFEKNYTFCTTASKTNSIVTSLRKIYANRHTLMMTGTDVIL